MTRTARALWGAALAALAVLAAAPAQAQRVSWERAIQAEIPRHSPPGDNPALAVDAAGDIYVALHLYSVIDRDCRVAKFSGATGGLIWSRDFDDPLADGFSTACMVTLGPDGHPVFAGGQQEMRVVKHHAASGEILWQGTTSATPGSLFANSVRGLAIDAAGNVVVSGTRQGTTSDQVIRVAKFAAADGALLWERADDIAGGVPTAVAIDSAGNVVVAGSRDTHIFADGNFIVLRYTPDGTRTWRFISDTVATGHTVSGLALDSAGNVFVTGTAYSGGVTDFKTLKLAGASGSVTWQRSAGGAGDDVPAAIVVDANGDAYVVGGAGSGTQANIALYKYRGSDGNQLWVAGASAANALALALDGAGRVVLTGAGASATPNVAAARTIAFDAASGALAWDRTLAASVRQHGLAVAAAGGAHVVVLATSSEPDGTSDMRLVKYAAGSATPVWSAGPMQVLGARDTSGWRLAIDAANAVYALGWYRGTTNVFDDNEEVLTVKLSADGAPQWRAVYAGPLPDGPTDIAIDGAGNVLVAGDATGAAAANSQEDFKALKLSGATGATLWNKTYNGAANKRDEAMAMAADAAGNMIVGGRSGTASAGDEGKVVKYRAADGLQLWERAISGATVWALGTDSAGNVLAAATGETDTVVTRYSADGAVSWQVTLPMSYPIEMAVDASGNALVAGSGFRTIKLAAASGAVLWDRIPAMPAGRSASVHAVAVDASGNVLVTGAVFAWLLPRGEIGVLKLASANGAIAWQRGLDEALPADPGSLAGTAIGADAAGDVWVAGHRGGTWAVTRFAGSDGTRLWEMPAAQAGSGRATGLAIRGSLVHVIGSGSLPTGGSMHVVKIDAAASGGAATGVSLSSSANPVTALQPVTFTATVSFADGTLLAGTVAFRTGGALIAGCGAVALVGNTAACTTSSVPAGGNIVTAQYSGDAHFAPSFSPSLRQQVDALAVTLALSADDNPIPGAGGTRVYARITGGDAPTGGVEFFADGVFVNGCQSLFNREASCYITVASGAIVRVTATYSGDAVHAPAIAPALTLESNPTPFPPRNVRLASGDFDGDGRGDLLWVTSAERYELWLMEGAGRRAFGAVDVEPAAVFAADFDGDGKADLLLQRADGAVELWLMDGTTRRASRVLQPRYSTWIPTGVGDFNGDGRADIAWSHVIVPRAQIWLMDGLETLSSTTHEGNGFRVAHTADFNADGKADIVWRHADGRVVLWLMNGGTFAASRTLQAAGSIFSAAHAGDFNADGKADIVWQGTDGRTVLWLMDGTATAQSLTVQAAGSAWRATHLADLNGDGRKDILWQNVGDGSVAAWLMNGVATLASQTLRAAGSGWSLALAADLDGGGKADLLWRNASGSWEIWLMDGLASTSQTAFSNSSPPAVPVPTTTTLTSTVSSATAGDLVSFTATVARAGGPVINSGTVTFRHGNTVISNCPSQSVANGTAQCFALVIPGGTPSITATYSGAAGLAGSTSNAVTLTMARAATTLSVTGTGPVNAGSPVTFKASVSGPFYKPGGPVTFFANEVPIAGCVALPYAVFEAPLACTTSALTPGTHAITAAYGGDESTLPSNTTTAWSQTILPAPPPPVIANPNRRVQDFNGDGKGDLLYHPLVGADTSVLWLMDGLGRIGGGQPRSALDNMLIVAVADFNADGRSDIVWRNRLYGNFELALMNGMTSTVLPLRPSVSGWEVQQVGDLDRDGNADIAWKHTDGRVELALMQGGTVRSSRVAQPAGSPFGVSHMADFNGDGKADILWRAADGRAVMWLMNGLDFIGSRTLQAAGGTATITHAADLNGDGKADLVWLNADGSIRLGLMDGVNETASALALPAGAWRVSHTGDFNGDGKADLLFRHSDGRVVLWLMNGVARTGLATLRAAGTPWSPAHVGDFDGDGKDDILWRNGDGAELWKMDGLATVATAIFDAWTGPPSATGAATTTTLAADVNPTTVGEAVIFTATVSSAAGTPTGLVTFYADGNPIPNCSEHVLSGGSTTCYAPTLAAGTRQVTARFLGGAEFRPSESAAIAQVVGKAASSLLIWTNSSNPSATGEGVTFQSEIQTPSPLVMGGTITFKADGADIPGCVALTLFVRGANCATSSLAAGARAITATYTGDANVLGSVSNTLNQTVNGPPPPPPGPRLATVDFDGDGKQDLLWHDAGSRQVQVWLMDGATALVKQGLPIAALDGNTIHIADFNGDGKSDLLATTVFGDTDLILMNGTLFSPPWRLRSAGSGWRVQRVGDFNGDGRADIVWKHDDGRVEIMLTDGTSILGTRTLQAAGSPFGVSHAADLNGDGKADILWRAADGRVIAWLMDGVNFTSSRTLQAAGGTGMVVHAADFNGDGKADLVWEYGDGSTAIALMDGVAETSRRVVQAAGSAWRVSHVADLNGDGKADLVYRNVTFGNVVAWVMDGTNFTASRTLRGASTGWAVTHTGPFDAGPASDILWRHTDGSVQLWLMNGVNSLAETALAPPGPGWAVRP